MEQNSNLSLNRIFHYTSKPDYLISILKNGFEPRFSKEKLYLPKDRLDQLLKAFNIPKAKDSELSDEVAIAMTCFCDIPFELVKNHVKQYGRYAIGLKKEWGEKHAICPVFYIPENSDSGHLINSMIANYYRNKDFLLEKIKELKSIDDRKDLSALIDFQIFFTNFIDLIFYIKPYKGFNPKTEEKNYKFYDEREWRHIPNPMHGKNYLSISEYDEYLKSGRISYKFPELKFTDDDITEVLVPLDEMKYFREQFKTNKDLIKFDINKLKCIPE